MRRCLASGTGWSGMTSKPSAREGEGTLRRPTHASDTSSARAGHGRAPFVLEGRGYYRCCKCRSAAVANQRRKIKRKLVAEAGGACALCGYSNCLAALQFHHLDRSSKAFPLSLRGVTKSLQRIREEADKCVLLCANCHAEVEAGVTTMDEATASQW